MIGEGNFVKIGVIVISIKLSKAAVFRLHAANPFSCALDRIVKTSIAALMHPISNRCRVVEIGIVRIYELKGPSAASHSWPVKSPVLGLFQQLFFSQPSEGLFDPAQAPLVADLLKRDTSPCAIPYRGYARLAVSTVLIDDQ